MFTPKDAFIYIFSEGHKSNEPWEEEIQKKLKYEVLYTGTPNMNKQCMPTHTT